MANKELLRILFQGVDAWNKWRRERFEPPFDLEGADLVGWDLAGADFSATDLSGANLAEANLSDAKVTVANLSGADLSRSYLTATNFTGTRLRDARFIGSRMSQTNLTATTLDLADFTGAAFSFAIFDGVDLSRVRGIEDAIHHGPSHLGVDTIYLSQGRIPEKFLRGCGAPEEMIDFVRAMTGKAIEFYSCFISYSSKDDDFAKRIRADLQSKGVRVWFAPEDLKIGDKFRSRIDEAIRVYDKLLIVLSENSINSAWVGDEVDAALEKEHAQNRTMLFPVRLDDAVMKTDQAWAASIRRTRQIGDMSAWKDHDHYQVAFERLLRDLKASEGK